MVNPPPDPSNPPGGDVAILRARFESEGWSYLRPGDDTNAPLLVAIHGYAQDPKAWFDYAVSLVESSWTVLVPVGPSSFYVRSKEGEGTNARGVAYAWIAHRDREAVDARNAAFIDASIEAAGRRVSFDRNRISWLGFSQGVGVAMHAARSLPSRPRAFVGLVGGVPKRARALCAPLAGMPTLWVSGARDTLYPPDYMRELVADLRGVGLAVKHESLDAGHEIRKAAQAMARAWFMAPHGM